MSQECIEECIHVQDVMNEVHGVLGTLSRRWTQEILIAAVDGARRFGEYRRAVSEISDRMLAVRLRELETLGLLSRTVVPSAPVQVLHAPTEHAEQLLHAIRPLVSWGEAHLAMAGRKASAAPAF